MYNNAESAETDLFEYYHLHADYMEHNSSTTLLHLGSNAVVCEQCSNKLKMKSGSRIPQYSLRAGFRFGFNARKWLPIVSMAENACIRRHRPFAKVIKIINGTATYYSML